MASNIAISTLRQTSEERYPINNRRVFSPAAVVQNASQVKFMTMGTNTAKNVSSLAAGREHRNGGPTPN